MKNFILSFVHFKSFILFLLVSANFFAQSIENVDFRAEGKLIVVTYDFFHPKADTMVNLELQFKDQQGISIIPKTLSGDLKNVKPGQAKRIVWDVLADGITLSGKYKAEVSIQRMAPWVKIGSQIWTTENLNVSTFRNGDPIPEAKTNEEWDKAGKNKQPAWCYYDNDPANGAKYGKLYNWYAVNDSRGLAPVGYHIPSNDEWTKLTDFLVAGSKMKSTSGWKDNGNGTNSSGFSGLPGGFRGFDGNYGNVGYYGYWWSASELNTTSAYNRGLYYYGDNLYRDNDYKERGFSVRCLRD
jgi:uncharacterized protein (TIGR02145 family)